MPTTERLRAALSDRYTVDREIGAGGMATVYLARDVKHDRDVALKVLRADLSAVIGAERFLSEVRITAKLEHPHILTLIDSGSADGLLYYVMPYVRGESLRARLTREKQLGIDEALAITKHVAGALDYAHKHGVVHRDIKPENILFHEGEAVLADFGIALAVKEAGGNRLTETGLSLGTPQYMSPEQATGDRALDARSDIYSLGAVLYEMLVGEPPVTGATAQAIIAKLLTERPTSIRIVRDTVPPGVDSAVNRALSKVPADRFASAGDFVRTLDNAIAAPTGPTAAPTARNSAIRYATAGGVAALVAVGGWFALYGRGDRSSGVTVADRTQVTFNGRVRFPSISGDGKQIAYHVRECGPSGCTYGIELQDIGGSATRRLFDGASAMYDIEWAADRRNLLAVASIRSEYGAYLVPTLGGVPRKITPFIATFWGSDSLLFVRIPQPNPDYWIYVSGLDGAAADSIRIAGFGRGFQGFQPIPGSKWIVFRVEEGASSTFVAIDRSGREQARMTTPLVNMMTASSDAVWMLMRSGAGGMHPVIARLGFDANTGRFASRLDTVYRLSNPYSRFAVTTDGGTLLFSEGTGQYDIWTQDYREAMRGNFPKERSILQSTLVPQARISPDGNRVLIARTDGSASGQWRLSVMPFDGGAEIPISAGVSQSMQFWTDSVTVAVGEKTTGTWKLSLIDVRTRARRAVFSLPDSSTNDFTLLAGEKWAWIRSDDRAFALQSSGTTPARELKISPWYVNSFAMGASPDKTKFAYVGWSAPSGDSLGLSVVSLPDGKETQWATVFGEDMSFTWQNDGSLVLMLQATGDSYELLRVRGPGQVERLGAIPRPAISVSVSRDLRRVVVTGLDERADAWTMRVIKK